MASCRHGNGRALCFDCFKAGMERTRARRAAWTQRELPFAQAEAARKLSEHKWRTAAGCSNTSSRRRGAGHKSRGTKTFR